MLYTKRRILIGCALLGFDFISLCLSYWISLYISYGCSCEEIPAVCEAAFRAGIPFLFLGCAAVFGWSRLYVRVWRWIGFAELVQFSCSAVAVAGGYFAVSYVLLDQSLPLRYYAIGGWLFLWVTLFSRFWYRALFYLRRLLLRLGHSEKGRVRAMLIGAGSAGNLILRDVVSNPLAHVNIVCIIDDDPEKFGCRLRGIPVVGARDDILANVKKYRIDEILFAIPTISAKEKRDILAICQETRCVIRMLPGVYSVVNGEVNVSTMREVTLEELLGREPIRVNTDGILKNLSSKVILVTGGGGSIGSELCRQIARHQPRQLIIFDIYENNAYSIEQELRRTQPDLHLTVLIGSVRDTRRIRQVFEQYRPQIVFHAAAHKHVPLMEGSPCEAIKNNVLGTYKTACAAMQYGAERFLLISTDKAVNPTNIMGASKRLCEMVIQSLDKVCRTGSCDCLPSFLMSHSDEETEGKPKIPVSLSSNGKRTEFVAVRFGNVLGSNGSVVPLFKKQIAQGGPVTVTHPDIIRYFMTIPEAVSLVLEAETFARGGEIYVLDMGDPVKIDDLARNLIKLSGLVPGEDIRIEYSGLRPGEKLYEEKLMAEEGLEKTSNSLIHVAKPLDWDVCEFLRGLEELACSAYDNRDDICAQVARRVPTFCHEGA